MQIDSPDSKHTVSSSEFAVLASHQLRSPVSAIGWLAEMLLNGDVGELNQTQTSYLSKLYESNRRLTCMLDALLFVSNIETKDIHPLLEPVDVNALVQKITKEELHSHPGCKNLVIKESYTKDTSELHLDEHITKQIMRNLISNARRYTPEGGTIEIMTVLEPKKLHKASKGSVRITVADSGPGIAKHEQKKVFLKFYRGDTIKTKHTDGIGLGLYIVKSLLEITGGSIALVSEKGQGCSFDVLLPLEGMRAGAFGGSSV